MNGNWKQIDIVVKMAKWTEAEEKNRTEFFFNIYMQMTVDLNVLNHFL